MIIVLILISIGILICSLKSDEYEMASIATIGGLIKILILCILCFKLSECRVIDKKIELYINQNKEIENKVELVIKEYMQHENNTFKDLKNEGSYITLVTLYPELKSDKLIEKEITLYEENNEKIISLKEQKINESIYKWWLYFGK